MAALKYRNNNGIDITDKEFREEFPAIFNRRRSVNVSEDYQLYRSDEVIELMKAEGMTLVEVAQERMGWSKKRQPHTQIHTMRFRAADQLRETFGVGDSFPEVVVMNSHDGRAVFRAMAGVFRLVCSNGMIVADQTLGQVRRRHFGEANAFAKVKEIISEVPRAVTQISERIERWSKLDLDAAAQLALAKACMAERSAPEWLQPEQVLEARRDGEGTDSNGHRNLWLTFNVLQESLTNARIDRLAGDGRARAIQPINATAGNVGINQRLWATADAYYNEHTKPLVEA